VGIPGFHYSRLLQEAYTGPVNPYSRVFDDIGEALKAAIERYLRSYPKAQVHILRKHAYALGFWLRAYPRMTSWKRFSVFIERTILILATLWPIAIGLILLAAGWIDRRFSR